MNRINTVTDINLTNYKFSLCECFKPNRIKVYGTKIQFTLTLPFNYAVACHQLGCERRRFSQNNPSVKVQRRASGGSQPCPTPLCTVAWSEDGDSSRFQDQEAVTERCRRYCERLYKNSDEHKPDQFLTPWDDLNIEPSTTRSEVAAALAALRAKKSPGPDQLAAEAMRPAEIDVLHKGCNNICHTGKWPSDWTRSIILAVHKKGSTTKYLFIYYRTLALICHANKLPLHIINNKIRHFFNWQVLQEQASFVKGKRTCKQILNIWQLIEKVLRV